ncbi:ABC-type dipeptide/oligopeptide/nickel transport system permease subunit [Bradyrhizobium sp. JR6.1]
MATLELSLDETEATPVRRRRGLGMLFWCAIGWMVLVFAVAIFADLLPLPSPTDMDMLERRAPVSAEHWLGTDGLGRDELSRLIYGARISLIVGLCAPMIGVTIGGALGILAGYFRGRFESFVVGGMDVLLAFPPLILALAVTAFLGQSIFNLTCILGVLGIPAFMRVARASTLTLARREFVIAAQALGATHARILLRELMPNVMLPLLAFFLLGVAVTIVVEGLAVLPRPRRAAADLELGQHDRGGARKSRCGAAARLHSGDCDVPDRALLQPDRRHHPRADRPEARCAMSGALLSVENAVVDLPTPRGNLRAVDHVDLVVGAGRTLGIVGESGCGKTMLSRAVLQLLPKKAKLSGRVMFEGQDLTKLPAEKLRKLRGRSLAVVFQDPMTLAQSGADHRHPADRDHPGASRARSGPGQAAQHRTADGGRHSRARAAADAISAPAVRRHAPARRDCGSAVLRAEAPDRGRADHRARRHDPGADPGSAGARAAAPSYGDDHHHA